jgi:type I restriction enzyme R subunit
VTAGLTFTPEQQRWLDRIREHMRANLSIDRDDFDLIPVFTDIGGARRESRLRGRSGWTA